jgi:hypothetical protein
MRRVFWIVALILAILAAAYMSSAVAFGAPSGTKHSSATASFNTDFAKTGHSSKAIGKTTAAPLGPKNGVLYLETGPIKRGYAPPGDLSNYPTGTPGMGHSIVGEAKHSAE